MYCRKSMKSVKKRRHKALAPKRLRTTKKRRSPVVFYFPDYSADSSLCGFIFSMILAFISSATSLFCAR